MPLLPSSQGREPCSKEGRHTWPPGGMEVKGEGEFQVVINNGDTQLQTQVLRTDLTNKSSIQHQSAIGLFSVNTPSG